MVWFAARVRTCSVIIDRRLLRPLLLRLPHQPQSPLVFPSASRQGVRLFIHMAATYLGLSSSGLEGLDESE
jgi:hypothetical protein